nr:ribonuclease H-like domain-containing protein [Tanacetum cinerariifolium]
MLEETIDVLMFKRVLLRELMRLEMFKGLFRIHLWAILQLFNATTVVEKDTMKGIIQSQEFGTRTGHRPHGPSINPRRPNMNGARPYKSILIRHIHMKLDLFLKSSAVRTQYRAPWVPTVNRNNPPGRSQNNIDDKGYWDSGCSRHMTGNISYLSDFEPFDEGYVSFGQGGCRITGKGTIKTDKLEFKNVYFVKDLKYNLFSYILHLTEYLGGTPDTGGIDTLPESIRMKTLDQQRKTW